MATTLDYTVGLFERRKFRQLLAERGFTYTEGTGFIDRSFYVDAEIEEHVQLSKEFYRG